MGYADNGINPQTGCLSGMLKTASLEYPGLAVKLIDLSVSGRPGEIVDNIMSELESENDSPEVGYEGEKRFELCSVSMDRPEKASSGIILSRDSVVVILGATGGIAGLIAKELARSYKNRLYLVSRTPYEPGFTGEIGDHDSRKTSLIRKYHEQGKRVSPVEIEEELARVAKTGQLARLVSDLKNDGAYVECYKCSVIDFDEMKEALSDIYKKEGRVDCIINAAGILKDKLIKNMTEVDFLPVVNLKLKSLMNVALCAPVCKAKSVVTFSSTSGRYGNKGQVNYSVANELQANLSYWLDTHRMKTGETRFRTIVWGGWHKTGMTDNPVITQNLTAQNFVFIEPADGVGYFLDELSYGNERETGYHGNFANRFFQNALKPRQLNVMRYGSVISFEPGKRIVIEKMIDNKYELFMSDHVIRGRVIVPACYVLELFANTGKLLYPDYLLKEFRDLEFLIPVTVQDKGTQVTIDCKLESGDSGDIVLSVVLSSQFLNTKLDMLVEKVHYKGRVVLGRSTEKYGTVEIPAEKGAVMSKEDVYRSKVIHFEGNFFQRIDKVISLNNELCLSEIAREDDGVLADDSYTPVNGSFLLRDGSFQTLAIIDSVYNNKIDIPFRIKRLRYTGDDQSKSFYCKAVKVGETKETLMGHITIFNKQGDIIEEMEDIEMYRFDKGNNN